MSTALLTFMCTFTLLKNTALDECTLHKNLNKMETVRMPDIAMRIRQLFKPRCKATLRYAEYLVCFPLEVILLQNSLRFID